MHLLLAASSRCLESSCAACERGDGPSTLFFLTRKGACVLPFLQVRHQAMRRLSARVAPRVLVPARDDAADARGFITRVGRGRAVRDRLAQSRRAPPQNRKRRAPEDFVGRRGDA
eukprot:6174097-Pleurochrysis_carterae.AAC.2